MATNFRRLAASGLVLAVLTTCGCNLGALSYFLFGPDDLHDPLCAELAKPKKEIKLAILANAGTETRPEFLRADRELAEMLSVYLRQTYKKNKTKIAIVPPAQVDNFKDQNPSWQTKSMHDIGGYFHADYVINIDLDKLDLYEPRSMDQFFRGQGDVSVTVFDMAQPARESRVFHQDFHYCYPERGPRSVMDNLNPAQFRAQFLTYMVKELARCFAAYSTDDKYAMD
jgi:hypothetical protein